MQVMMNHRIDRRDIETMVQEDEPLPQQITGDPGQDEGQEQFPPSDIPRRPAELEQNRIQHEEQQQGDKGK